MPTTRRRRSVPAIASLLTLLPLFMGCRSTQSYTQVYDPAVVLYKTGTFDKDDVKSRSDWRADVARFTGATEQEITDIRSDRGAYRDHTIGKANGGSGGDRTMAAGGSERRARLLRDRVVREHLSDIEQYHEAYKMSLHMRVATGGFMFDFANLALTFAGTIVGGEEAKTIISAVANLTSGTKLALTDNFLQDQAMTAILSQMDAECDDQRLEIERRLKKPTDGYSLEQADEDLVRYFAAGSLINSILNLAAEAGQREQASKAKLRLEQSESTALRNEIKTWVQENDANLASLDAWLDGQGITGPSAGTWLFDPKTSDANLRAATIDLKVPALTPPGGKTPEPDVEEKKEKEAEKETATSKPEA